MNYAALIQDLLDISLDAGRIIMDFYKTDVDIEHKEDDSPVTAADIAADRHITEALQKLTPDIPVISEEGTNFSASDNMERFWLVDPLDGTKSFIRRDGQFTVNIGLIEKNTPVLGVLYIPAQHKIYYTGEDGGAYRIEEQGKPVAIQARLARSDGLVVCASKSHRTKETEAFIETLSSVKTFIPASSALKFALLAEGKADVYPRFGPTMEWDTAAGHAILLAAGGSLANPDGSAFTYGKPGYKNGYFVAWGKRE